MKYLITFILFILSVSFSNAQSLWNIGLQTGVRTNFVEFSGGNEKANALFQYVPVTSAHLDVLFRYKINTRLSFQTGLSFSEMGFSYAIAKDYSLLKPIKTEADLTSTTCITTIPAMIIWNSKLNCRNKRFILGAGFYVSGIDENYITETTAVVSDEEGANQRTTSISEKSSAKSSGTGGFAWMAGIEKVKRSGNSFVFSIQGNHGFEVLSESTVNYTASNKIYNHTFQNYGSNLSLSFAYHFMPFGSKKIKAAILEKL